MANIHQKQHKEQKLNLAQKALVAFIKFYRIALSPLKLTNSCRFYPSCSSYAIEAIKIHGAIKGGWLFVLRIIRCNPFGAFGFDPVPPKNNK